MAYNDDEASRAIKGAYMRTWTAQNREARAAYMREYVKNNRDAINENRRRHREKNREKIRQASRLAIRDENGQITEKEKKHQERNRAQRHIDLETMAGRPRPEICDICGGPPDPKRGMHFDHCHKTHRFRGWLCRKCNLMLGNAEDDPTRLRDGAAYLERFREVSHE